jgi:hypothetical protein
MYLPNLSVQGRISTKAVPAGISRDAIAKLTQQFDTAALVRHGHGCLSSSA